MTDITQNGSLKRDDNDSPVMGGTSSSDNATIINAAFDPVTRRLLTDSASGSGTVTSVSVVTANGFAGSVANPTTTPAITLSTTITGILIGNGTAISAASPSTDYAALAFKTIAVSGQSDVVADSPIDILTLVAGSGMTITTNASTDTITFAASGGAATSITVGTTTITSGTNTRILYDNAGTLGEYTITGTGTVVVMANTPTLITPVIGEATGTSVVLSGSGAISSFANTADSASLQVMNLKGARATPTANDEIYESFTMNNSTPAAKEYARITTKATTITASSEVASIDFYIATAGTLTNSIRFIRGAIFPTSNDTVTLGIATNNIQDVFLANGAVTSWRNAGNSAADMTLTHAIGSLTFAGGNILGLGATTATTFNGLTITANGTNTLNIAAGKTFVVSNGITLAGTDSTVMTFPTTSKTIAANDGSNWTIASQAIGDILTATSTTAYGRLAAVATGSVLVSAGTGTAPAYSANPQITTIELGAATDTTLARVSAGVISVEGITIPSISSTNTLTNKYITPQLQSVADAGGTLTPVSITNDMAIATALSQATTIAAPSGSPVQGEKLTIRLKDNGTARALTWNAIYRASSDLALPTTTVISKTMYCGFIYNSTDTKWDFVAFINNF